MSEVVRIARHDYLHLRKLWKAKFSYCVMLYYWWGCRGNLEYRSLGGGGGGESVRENAVPSMQLNLPSVMFNWSKWARASPWGARYLSFLTEVPVPPLPPKPPPAWLLSGRWPYMEERSDERQAEFVWHTSDICLQFLWHTSDICLQFLWHTSDICLQFLWHTSDICLQLASKHTCRSAKVDNIQFHPPSFKSPHHWVSHKLHCPWTLNS